MHWDDAREVTKLREELSALRSENSQLREAIEIQARQIEGLDKREEGLLSTLEECAKEFRARERHWLAEAEAINNYHAWNAAEYEEFLKKASSFSALAEKCERVLRGEQ